MKRNLTVFMNNNGFGEYICTSFEEAKNNDHRKNIVIIDNKDIYFTYKYGGEFGEFVSWSEEEFEEDYTVYKSVCEWARKIYSQTESQIDKALKQHLLPFDFIPYEEHDLQQTVSLLKAVSNLYSFENKQSELIYDIVFSNGYDKDECKSGYHIMIGKYWNKLLKEWVYSVKEPYCPILSADEGNFLGKLFASGIRHLSLSFGGNIAPYTVYEGVRYKDPILSHRGNHFSSREDCDELLNRVKEEITKETNNNRYEALCDFQTELEVQLEKYKTEDLEK